jgi:acetyl-CoA carboxylase biotin carboxylase subunit
VYLGWTIPIDYDPLLAKLAVWAPARETAIARMIRALDEYSVDGIKTNIGFFRQIFLDRRFRDGDIHTGYLDEFLRRTAERKPDVNLEAVAALVAATHAMNRRGAEPCAENGNASRWLAEGRESMLR